MKIWIVLSCLALVGITVPSLGAGKKGAKEYVIVANQGLKQNVEWAKVIAALQSRHKAEVVYYLNSPVESKAALQRFLPRYVAFVERPERINREYVVRINRMSREIDEDVYVDFRWGIITGYDAAAALRLVEDAREPMTVRTAVSTTTGVSDQYFERFALISDSKKGEWGVKDRSGDTLKMDTVAPDDVLAKFCDLYRAVNPDVLFTASHATERNLEMPFSLGYIRPEGGRLYARPGKEKEFLSESANRKVYFPVGNCLIGNVDNSRETMAIAWLNSARVGAMLAYVVPTWHGAGGWGSLKVWTDSPGQYSLSDAFFINMQVMQAQMAEWGVAFSDLKFGHETIKSDAQMARMMDRMAGVLATAIGREPTKDQLGLFYDEDVMVYYGDPKWDVRLQALQGSNDGYRVDCRKEKKKCVVTVTTENGFNADREIPCSYIFPERLKNPRLAEGEKMKAFVADDFMLLYGLQAGKTYRLEIEEGK